MLHQQIASNKRMTIVVIALYMVLFIAVGIGIGYFTLNNATAGVILAVVIGGIYSLMMISNATNVVMQLNHAREITVVKEQNFSNQKRNSYLFLSNF